MTVGRVWSLTVGGSMECDCWESMECNYLETM